MIKSTILSLLALGCLSSLYAATINFSTTSTGSRVVSVAATSAPASDFTAPQLIAPGGYLIGTMANEADASTFKVLGSALLGTSSGFAAGGVPNVSITNNTALAGEFAGQRAYILFFSGNTVPVFNTTTGAMIGTTVNSAFAGIYKSTQNFVGTLSSSAVSSDTLTVANFTTAINPTSNWNYETVGANNAKVTSGASSYTGVAGGVARTGTVFDLATAIPEPSTAALGLLAGLGLMVHRRRD